MNIVAIEEIPLKNQPTSMCTNRGRTFLPLLTPNHHQQQCNIFFSGNGQASCVRP